MFRPMKRAAQQLSAQEVKAVLEKGTSGVLAMQGKDGYPYALPISYAYDGAYIYMHTGPAGLKMELLNMHDKVSFCVIDCDQIIPEENTTAYRSVIAFGRVEMLSGQERLDAHLFFTRRFNPGYEPSTGEQPGNVVMLRMRIDHMTGKQGRKLLESRKV
ncbi:MAG: pyridoxamine 5'-phosphate oxidase family protein [Clostridia bacterium]|nr:pyridoxamine 5'-phosphate oxidase family protein [Clostridia bacterium]